MPRLRERFGAHVFLPSDSVCKLINADCLDAMASIPDNSVDMIFCDLPYGTTRNPWDSIIALDKLWAQYERIIKDNGAIVLTASAPFDKVLACSNLALFRYEWIWLKNKTTGHLNCKKLPLKAHENVLVFYKKPPVYNPQFTDGHEPKKAVKPKKHPQAEVLRAYGHADRVETPSGSTKRYPITVINIPIINNDDPLKWHPTQKPVALAAYFIRTYSNPGDVVLDNCMGSGSTGIACLQEGRRFIGIERDPEYFNRAQRWIDAQEVNTIKS